MPARLILIRHGQTAWNRRRRYAGSTDVGLSPVGRMQARKLRQRLEKENIRKIFTSDLRRAAQTAALVFKNRRIEETSDFREIHFGCFEGHTPREILKTHGALYRKWLKDPSSVTIPGAESLSDFRSRIQRVFKKIASRYSEKTVAVVCHGGVISAFLTSVVETKDFWKWIPDSASITAVEYERGRFKALLFNDTAHLLKKNRTKTVGAAKDRR